jgi:hypothetical protein
VNTIRSVPVTVPPEKATLADSRGRFGSGGAYAAGQLAVVVVAVGLGRGLALALGLATVLGDGARVAVAVSDGVGVSTASGPSLPGADVLQPASSAAITTHEVRTVRR